MSEKGWSQGGSGEDEKDITDGQQLSLIFDRDFGTLNDRGMCPKRPPNSVDSALTISTHRGVGRTMASSAIRWEVAFRLPDYEGELGLGL